MFDSADEDKDLASQVSKNTTSSTDKGASKAETAPTESNSQSATPTASESKSGDNKTSEGESGENATSKDKKEE